MDSKLEFRRLLQKRHGRDKGASRRNDLAVLWDISGIEMSSLTICAIMGPAADLGRDLQLSPGPGVHGSLNQGVACRTSVWGGFAREDSRISSIRGPQFPRQFVKSWRVREASISKTTGQKADTRIKIRLLPSYH